MNIVDSSGWLEYFTDGSLAASFELALKNTENLLVPTICLYEVFKVVLRESGEHDALQAVALMRQGQIADLTADIAVEAARISFEHKIPMADSIVFATARTHEAKVWTLDSDFQKFPAVKYFKR